LIINFIVINAAQRLQLLQCRNRAAPNNATHVATPGGCGLGPTAAAQPHRHITPYIATRTTHTLTPSGGDSTCVDAGIGRSRVWARITATAAATTAAVAAAVAVQPGGVVLPPDTLYDQVNRAGHGTCGRRC
jgi:hypothetical protein